MSDNDAEVTATIEPSEASDPPPVTAAKVAPSPDYHRWGPRDTPTREAGIGVMAPWALEAIEARARSRNYQPGVPTGYERFDLMTGGLEPEQLTVLAGRPGVGKTALAIRILLHAGLTKRIPVLCLTPDASKYDLMERMLASVTGFPVKRFRLGQLEYTDWKNSIYPAGAALKEAPIVLNDGVFPSISALEESLDRFLKMPALLGWPEPPEGEPRKALVVVDSLHSIAPIARGDTAERELTEVARGLKNLARAYCLPFLVTSQVNRNPVRRADSRPDLSDLRGSGAIESYADLVAFLHQEPSEDLYMELIVAKNRMGPTGTIPLIRDVAGPRDRQEDDEQ